MATGTLTLAAVRRKMLTNAVQDWRSTFDKDEADIALEASLLANQIITEEDVVEKIYWDSNDAAPGVVIITADGEQIYVDKQGNVTRGAAE